MEQNLKELQELWDKLGDIPVNNDDEIEEDFLNFPAGTSKFDVWHWFDERCPNGVAEDLMYGFEVTKIDNDDVLDSCWGYYGDDSVEDIEAERKSVIDGFVKEEKQARLNYLRQKIRKKGLQLRLPFLDYPQIKVSI